MGTNRGRRGEGVDTGGRPGGVHQRSNDPRQNVNEKMYIYYLFILVEQRRGGGDPPTPLANGVPLSLPLPSGSRYPLSPSLSLLDQRISCLIGCIETEKRKKKKRTLMALTTGRSGGGGRRLHIATSSTVGKSRRNVDRLNPDNDEA